MPKGCLKAKELQAEQPDVVPHPAPTIAADDTRPHDEAVEPWRASDQRSPQAL